MKPTEGKRKTCVGPERAELQVNPFGIAAFPLARHPQSRACGTAATHGRPRRGLLLLAHVTQFDFDGTLTPDCEGLDKSIVIW